MRSALNAPSVGATFQLHPKPTTGFLFFLGFGLLFAPHFWAGLFFQAKIFHLHFVCGGTRQQAKYSHAGMAQVHPAASRRYGIYTYKNIYVYATFKLQIQMSAENRAPCGLPTCLIATQCVWQQRIYLPI